MQLGLTVTSISLEGAEALLDAAIAKSVADGKAMVIAVVDAAGNLKAFRRMDGSPNLSVDIAINKAWTASSYGYPIMIDGQLAGGIGSSGGHYSEDMAVAEAALAAVGLA